jgi:hypothetical protein
LAYTDRSVNQISPLLSIAPQMENRISRVCAVGIGWGYSLNIAADLQSRDIAPSADALYRTRMANLGADDSFWMGCLPRGPRDLLGSGPGPQLVKIEQKENLVLVLSEALPIGEFSWTLPHCLRTRARASWAARWGHWKGETLVVEGNGFTMEGCTNPR